MANSPSGESVLDRIMRVLTALETEPELTPSSLAEETGLPKSTAYRLIDELAQRGLLERTAEGHVTLGRRLWEIAQHTPLASTLRHTALPYMEDLNAVVQQTTQLAVLEEGSVMIVERLSAERPTFRAELDQTRRRGYASLEGLIHRSTTGTSVPILDRNGHAAAALTTVVPTGSHNVGAHVMALQQAARGIAHRLQGRPEQRRTAAPTTHRPPTRPTGEDQPVLAHL